MHPRAALLERDYDEVGLLASSCEGGPYMPMATRRGHMASLVWSLGRLGIIEEADEQRRGWVECVISWAERAVLEDSLWVSRMLPSKGWVLIFSYGLLDCNANPHLIPLH